MDNSNEIQRLNKNLSEYGYQFNPKKFLITWVNGFGKVPSPANLTLFEFASIYMVMAYQHGFDGGQLESLFPFLEKTEVSA